MPKVEIALTKSGPGIVAMLLEPDGKRTIVKECYEGSIIFPVEKSYEVIIVDNTKSFSDITGESWYTDNVIFVTSREIFNGVGNEMFSPTGMMNLSDFSFCIQDNLHSLIAERQVKLLLAAVLKGIHIPSLAKGIIGGDKDNVTLPQRLIILALLQNIEVDHALIISHTKRKMLLARRLDFDIIYGSGIVLNIDVKAHALCIVPLIDCLL